MRIHPVELELRLPDDPLLDLFIFQWHTPDPIAGHSLAKIQEPVLTQKRVVLEQFRDWFLLPPQQANAARAAFVILPEVSLPLGHVAIIDSLLQRTDRPLVVIAGFEHLTWGEYDSLRGQMNATTFFETQAGNSTHLNLAGIWIRDCNNNCQGYLQSKLHPADEERGRVHEGENVLFFRSRRQGGGERMNFCVQVCSDFCTRENVLRLRQEIDRECPGQAIDITFLLQDNPNQEVTYFLEGNEAYFRGEVRHAATHDGCVLFANNANPAHGKSTTYGRSKVTFPLELSWKDSRIPPDTYRLHKYDTYCQAAIVRESGPAVYWMTYKPHCVVNRRPATGQPLPFITSRWSQIGEGGLVCNGHVTFSALPAEQHWLNNEWAEDEKEYAEELVERGRGSPRFELDVVPRIRQGYADSTSAWRKEMADVPVSVRPALNRYFVCWKLKGQYPGEEPEPHEWVSDVAKAVKKLMRCYAVMKVGDGAVSGHSLSPHVEYSMHVRFTDAIHGVFLWGGSNKSPREMITVAKEDCPELAHLQTDIALILVDAVSEVDTRSLQDLLSVNNHRVTKASMIEGLEPHLKPAGEVTNPLEKKSFKLVWSGALMAQLYDESNQADLQTRLRGYLSECLLAEERTDGQTEGH